MSNTTKTKRQTERDALVAEIEQRIDALIDRALHGLRSARAREIACGVPLITPHELRGLLEGLPCDPPPPSPTRDANRSRTKREATE